MKKIVTGFLLLAMAGVLFAGGRGEMSGRTGLDEPREIISLEGELSMGDYGHLVIKKGDTIYTLGRPEFFSEQDLNSLMGSNLSLEGVEGPVRFTKGDLTYRSFRVMKVTADGEVLDLKELMIAPRGMGSERGAYRESTPMDRSGRTGRPGRIQGRGNNYSGSE